MLRVFEENNIYDMTMEKWGHKWDNSTLFKNLAFVKLCFFTSIFAVRNNKKKNHHEIIN